MYMDSENIKVSKNIFYFYFLFSILITKTPPYFQKTFSNMDSQKRFLFLEFCEGNENKKCFLKPSKPKDPQ